MFAAKARAEVRLEIAGSVGTITEETIEVRVDLTNRGTESAQQVLVAGELLEHETQNRLPLDIAAGETRGLTLDFPVGGMAAGVHAVALRIDYHTGPEATATPFSQPAWVLIAMGEQVGPSVKLRLTDASVDVTGRLDIVLESADGDAHWVHLAVKTPRTLRAHPLESVVLVPGSGTLTTWVQLFRVDAPWNTRQGLLVIARDDTGPLVRTAVAAGAAQVGGDPARLPRLRRPLIALALLLLALAVGAELWSRRHTPVAA